jgi:hypothetical protein
VDLKKLKTSEWVMLGGAFLVFIGTFLKWFKVDDLGFGVGGGSVNGFHYFLQGTIPWLLAVAVAAFIIIRGFFPNVKVPDAVGSLNWSQLYLIGTVLALVLIFTRIISVDGPSEFVDRGTGIFIAFLGAIVMVVGAVMKFQSKEELGGTAAGPGPSTSPPTPF